MLPAGKPFPVPADRQQDIPLLRFGVHRVPQRVVGVVLEGHAGRGVPLGVFLAKALLGIGSQPQLLPLPQLHNQDVCKSTCPFEKAAEEKWVYGITLQQRQIFGAQEDVTGVCLDS